MPPPDLMGPPAPLAQNRQNDEQSITEILRAPTKVVLLRNMVGPGEVDDDLEPETKEECGRYGEVVSSNLREPRSTTAWFKPEAKVTSQAISEISLASR